MRRVFPLFAVGVLILGLVGVFSVAQATASKSAAKEVPTVGDFVVEYARTVGLGGEGTTPEQALGALRSSGRIDTTPVDLNVSLTEGAVVRLTSSANLGIASEKPAREFSRVQTNTFFSVFSPALQNGNGNGKGNGSGSVSGNASDGGNPNNGHGVDPRTRGKGKKKGLSNHFPF